MTQPTNPTPDWQEHPPFTEAEWLSFNSWVTRYKDREGKERAVLLWEDYELLLRLARLAD